MVHWLLTQGAVGAGTTELVAVVLSSTLVAAQGMVASANSGSPGCPADRGSDRGSGPPNACRDFHSLNNLADRRGGGASSSSFRWRVEPWGSHLFSVGGVRGQMAEAVAVDRDFAKLVSRQATEEHPVDEVLEYLMGVNLQQMSAALPVVQALKNARPEFLKDLAARAVQRLPDLGEAQVANVAAAFAKLRQFDLQLNKAIAEETLSRFDRFSFDSLTRILKAFSELSYQHNQLMHRVGDRAVADAQHATAESLARLLRAYGMLAWSHEQRSQLLGAMVEKLTAAMEPQALAETVAALDSLGWADTQCPQVLNSVGDFVEEHVGEFHPAALAAMVGHLASLGHYDYRMYQVVADHAADHMDSFSAEEVARLLWAFGEMHVHNRRLLDAMERRLPDLAGDLGPMECAVIVKACNQLSFYSTHVQNLAWQIQTQQGDWTRDADV